MLTSFEATDKWPCTCWKRKPFFLHLLLYSLNNNHDINTNGCWCTYICFPKTTVVMCLLTSLQLQASLRMLLLFCFSNEWAGTNYPLSRFKNCSAGFYETCLFVLSSCGLVYRRICGFVHYVMRGNNSWIPPGGARHTADGQPGSYTDCRA